MKHTSKRKKHTRKRRIIVLRIKIALFGIFFAGILLCLFQRDAVIDSFRGMTKAIETFRRTEPEEETEAVENTAEITDDIQPEEEEPSVPVLIYPAETSIYTFMQGPVAWKTKTPWSGVWCDEVLGGQKFSVFGCGLCDLANIYSTLSPYECSPVDMFTFAQEASGYAPGGGHGAIDWPDLKKTLHAVGFSCEIYDKDPSYEAFCEAMERAVTAIVLVSSYDDSSYWKDTEGHYVNIWNYNSETGEVFLADSGNPEHNRTWIPLETVYRALKTSGEHQYLLVGSYQEEANTWKYSGIKEEWTIPEYYVPKAASD